MHVFAYVCLWSKTAWVRASWRESERRVHNCVHAFAKISDALPSSNPERFQALTRANLPSPVHDAVPVQGHEVHLAAASRSHRCEKDLVISLTKELQPLSSFVHEHTIQVPSLH